MIGRRGRVHGAPTQASGLLENVRQLVCEKVSSTVGVRGKPVAPEDDMVTDGIGLRSDGPRRAVGGLVMVDPDRTEIKLSR
jgi:hypothetical protein